MTTLAHLEQFSVAQPEFPLPLSRWSEDDTAGMAEEQLLLYRSNLLGRDLTLTNFGGGNTSAKIVSADPVTGAPVRLLFVKGSGGDLGSMGLDGFAILDLARLKALIPLYKGEADEDRMVGLLPHCAFGPGQRAASIDTPLHAFLPAAHVDHIHPDAVIALATAADGAEAARAIWGDRIGWIPWRRPGFQLGLDLAAFAAEHPEAEGAILAGHGLISWAETSRDCYERSIGLVADAAAYLNDRAAGRPVFGGVRLKAPDAAERRRHLAAHLPYLRGLVSDRVRKLAHVADDAATLAFVNSLDCERLAAIGTSCPDHFLRTKIRPLVLPPDILGDRAAVEAAIGRARADYAAYHARHATADDPPMRDPNPVILLLPGLGRVAFAADRTTARIASEFYGNAINVMRGAELLGGYRGLDAGEAFRIEYWALEEAKLRRLPLPKPLQGRIALVTGAAGGIGLATARRLLADGCCVMLTDLDATALAEALARLVAEHGADRVASHICDVTDEDEVEAAFDACVLAFGGVDILVANAGIASSAPVEETSLALWRRNHAVLSEGYFLSARAAFARMRPDRGGSIVFIGSKNALAATPNASAYASAKASALHLARCLALEGAASGIRVNVVNPDAVIRGSRIWSGDWRAERAGAHGIDPGEELEAFYRERSMLKADVLPEDVAEAVHFFASDRSAKSTGNVLNVDAGNAQAFTR